MTELTTVSKEQRTVVKKSSFNQTQIMDVSQALAQVNAENNQLDRQKLKASLARLKPVLKKNPALKLFVESSAVFPQSDYQPIALDVVTLQTVLSKILQEVMTLKAANILFKDIMNYNKKKTAKEVQNFFLLQEVYGY